MLHPISGGQGPLPAVTPPVESPRVQPPQQEPNAEPRTPRRDQYTPEEAHIPTGLYWMGKDEDGQPAIFFDDPEVQVDRSPGQKDAEELRPEKLTPTKKAETVTANTDQVDQEIRKLREEKEQLQQQLNSETDQQKIKELERKLATVQRELEQKDNDAYRRQHTVLTFS